MSNMRTMAVMFMSVCPVTIGGGLDTFLLCTAAIAALNSKGNTNVVVVIHLGGSMSDLTEATTLRTSGMEATNERPTKPLEPKKRCG